MLIKSECWSREDNDQMKMMTKTAFEIQDGISNSEIQRLPE